MGIRVDPESLDHGPHMLHVSAEHEIFSARFGHVLPEHHVQPVRLVQGTAQPFQQLLALVTNYGTLGAADSGPIAFQLRFHAETGQNITRGI